MTFFQQKPVMCSNANLLSCTLLFTKTNKIDSLTQAKLKPLSVRRGRPGQLNAAKSFGGRRSPRPPSWRGGGWLPLPKNPTPALGLSGLGHVPQIWQTDRRHWSEV